MTLFCDHEAGPGMFTRPAGLRCQRLFVAGAMVVAATIAPVVAVVMVVATAEEDTGVHQRCGGLFCRVNHCGLGGGCECDGQHQDQKWHNKYRGLFHGISDGWVDVRRSNEQRTERGSDGVRPRAIQQTAKFAESHAPGTSRLRCASFRSITGHGSTA